MAYVCACASSFSVTGDSRSFANSATSPRRATSSFSGDVAM